MEDLGLSEGITSFVLLRRRIRNADRLVEVLEEEEEEVIGEEEGVMVMPCKGSERDFAASE